MLKRGNQFWRKFLQLFPILILEVFEFFILHYPSFLLIRLCFSMRLSTYSKVRFLLTAGIHDDLRHL